MVPTLDYNNPVIVYRVHKPVRLGNTSTPKPLQIVLQLFLFACSTSWITDYLFD